MKTIKWTDLRICGNAVNVLKRYHPKGVVTVGPKLFKTLLDNKIDVGYPIFLIDSVAIQKKEDALLRRLKIPTRSLEDPPSYLYPDCTAEQKKGIIDFYVGLYTRVTKKALYDANSLDNM